MQESFWETIHSRGEWWDLCFVPNPLATDLQEILPARSKILEVGCSSGRDARYFASHGHFIVAMDFSKNALKRMMDHARKQGIDVQITPVHKNVAEGLPDFQADSIDCFYSRSSLHVDDDTMVQLAKKISLYTKKGGIIAIEGRTENDTPILESEDIGDGLAINWKQGGHLRRIWRKDFCIQLAKDLSWEIITLEDRHDDLGNEKNLLRFVAKKGSV
ncbi:MAG: class I SAM-dependent methyltransferase [Candidatus Paceibacterota bacterium]